MTIHPETPAHIPAIHRLNSQAFGRPGEADLVDALRANGRATLSLVALNDDEEVVGHILFFPLEIQGEQGSHPALGLGPMAVLPAYQKQGIGTALVHHALETLKLTTHPGVIVLGHPEFYPRFGFVPASRYRIQAPFPAPDEAFLALELQPGALGGINGIVSYPEEFSSL